MQTLPRAIFISHGGGPLPLLGEPNHQEMVAALKQIAANMPRPKAIVVVSAHWEESRPTLTSAQNPTLIYDYYGFPPESYEIQYPCPGKPALAKEIIGRLTNSGIDAGLDETRGLDHGVFVPLTIMYPEADIPCLQLSLVSTLNPATHIAMGKALENLHQQDVLLIGSGFSFHNLREFFATATSESTHLNVAFEEWLKTTCGDETLSEAERQARLIHWGDAPGARFCHPREEHLLPLHVCYGAAQRPYTQHIELTILNKQSGMFIW